MSICVRQTASKPTTATADTSIRRYKAYPICVIRRFNIGEGLRHIVTMYRAARPTPPERDATLPQLPIDSTVAAFEQIRDARG